MHSGRKRNAGPHAQEGRRDRCRGRTDVGTCTGSGACGCPGGVQSPRTVGPATLPSAAAAAPCSAYIKGSEEALAFQGNCGRIPPN